MTVRIDQTDLFAFVARVFRRCGLSPSAAETAAEAVCYGDVRGLTTHGTSALATIYVPQLLDRRIDPGAKPTVVQDSGVTAVVDGQRGLGSVSMTLAIDLAGYKARQHGVGAVAVRNSSHFGCAGYYTNRLARFGLVGVAMTNCGSQCVVPALNGSAGMLGANPLSAAVPAGNVPPFVLDTGDAKAYGLALLVNLLCGPLAGGGASSAGGAVAHFALALDPAAFGPVDGFARAAREILATVERDVTYPGAAEADRVAAAALDGVSLPDPVAADIRRLAERLGLPVPQSLRFPLPLGAAG